MEMDCIELYHRFAFILPPTTPCTQTLVKAQGVWFNSTSVDWSHFDLDLRKVGFTYDIPI